MDTVRFTCTSLTNTGKRGVLKPDAAGYYTMPIGGLNVLNSAGMYYTYQGAKALFEESSSFMRRVKRGALRGENGHPKMRPGESMDEYMVRAMNIDEKNICVQFKEIFLDFDNYKGPDGKPIVAIIGVLTPSGPLGPMLQKSLDNPGENVCFSIRSFTDDYWVRGVKNRDIKTIVTFDYVNEPGIANAEKYKSMAIEEHYDRPVTRPQIERAFERQTVSLGMESVSISQEELISSFGWKPKQDKPSYFNW